MSDKNIQSIIFDRKIFSEKKAIQYLKDHGKKYKDIDITKNFIRFRQKRPLKKYSYITKEIQRGIKYILIVSHIF